jgi:hypothetical protein
MPMSTDSLAPARAVAVFAWLWLLAALPFVTDAACDILAGLIIFFSWCFLAFWWAGMGAVGWPLPGPARRWWLSAGLAGCLGPALALTDAGLIARVALSRPWLDAHAAGVVAGTNELPEGPHRVGLFVVDETREMDGVVVLYTGSGFLNRNGIARFPDGPVPLPRIRYVRHLTGPWYRFEWKF